MGRHRLVLELEELGEGSEHAVVGGVALHQGPDGLLGGLELSTGPRQVGPLQHVAPALLHVLAGLLGLLEQPRPTLGVALGVAHQLAHGERRVPGVAAVRRQLLHELVEQLGGLLVQRVPTHGVDAGDADQQAHEPGDLDHVPGSQADRFAEELLGFGQPLHTLVAPGHAQQAVGVGQGRVELHRRAQHVDGGRTASLAHQQRGEPGPEPAVVGEQLDAPLQHRDGAVAGPPSQVEGDGLVEDLGHRRLLDGVRHRLLDHVVRRFVAAEELEPRQVGVGVGRVGAEHFLQPTLEQIDIGPRAAHQPHRSLEHAVVVVEFELLDHLVVQAAPGTAVGLLLQGELVDPFGAPGHLLVHARQLAQDPEVPALAVREAPTHDGVDAVATRRLGADHVEQTVGQQLQAFLPADAEIGQDRTGRGVAQMGHPREGGSGGVGQLLDPPLEVPPDRTDGAHRLQLEELLVVGQLLSVGADPDGHREGAYGERMAMQPLRHRAELVARDLGRFVGREDLVVVPATQAAHLEPAQHGGGGLAVEDRLLGGHEDQPQRVAVGEQRHQEQLEPALAEEVGFAAKRGL